MKKKIIGCFLVLTIAAVAAFNLNLNTNKVIISNISLANIEALAQTSGEEVIISCNQQPLNLGQCWRDQSPWYLPKNCAFSGSMSDYCSYSW